MSNFITLDTLQRKAPSIFTEDSADRTSEKYQHISTSTIINGLMQEGFFPTWVGQSNSRLANKKAYAKHMIRFRHRDTKPSFSQLFPELVLVNSHDGLSSYRLNAGLFRLVCSNGLVAGHSYDEIRVRHQGDIVNNVIEGTYRIIENTQAMIESAEQMASIDLNKEEKDIFVEAAHTLRFEDSAIGEAIAPEKLLKPRRIEDMRSNDLFTVFNVIQENTLRGGVSGFSRDANGHLNRVRTREIKSIDQNVKLNKALWTLAEKMTQLKAN